MEGEAGRREHLKRKMQALTLSQIFNINNHIYLYLISISHHLYLYLSHLGGGLPGRALAALFTLPAVWGGQMCGTAPTLCAACALPYLYPPPPYPMQEEGDGAYLPACIALGQPLPYPLCLLQCPACNSSVCHALPFPDITP